MCSNHRNRVEAGFPRTGIGYTHGWCFQDRSDRQRGEGVVLAEFALVPSYPGDSWLIEVVNVQNTAAYLGTATAWPGVRE